MNFPARAERSRSLSQFGEERGPHETPRSGTTNVILAGAEPADLQALEPFLTQVALRPRQTLQAAADPISSIYFIDRGLVTATMPIADDFSSATRVVRRDGACGVCACLANAVSSETMTVLTPGAARRIAAHDFRRMFHNRRSLAERILSYISIDIGRLQSDLGCSRHHSVEQRFARLLLTIREDQGIDLLALTQEEISLILGVQRTTITAIAHHLKTSGALAYSRGRIRIVDVDQLKAVACRCGIGAAEEA